jgi:DNA polymerase-3 subunit delta
MSQTVHVFDYLHAPDKFAPAPVCIVFGDEPFLKQQALQRLRCAVLEDEDAPFTAFEGTTSQWRDVFDELATVALFGGDKRLALVTSADAFVSNYRSRLESYFEKPKTCGVLILDVATWQSNTRLYKQADRSGLQIDCRAPQKAVGRRKVLDEGRLSKWLVTWSRSHHQARLQPMAAQLLLELVGPQFGLLDQELAKLALFAGLDGEVTPEMVRDVVGGWRTQTIWELLDAACDGKSDDALRQLDRLLHSGENALGLFGRISWSLRRFAAATRNYENAQREGRRIGLRQALEQAGFRPWPKGAIERAEQQLKQLGRQRAGRLYRWLLEADLALKGSHSTPHRARFVLEQLLVRLSKDLDKNGSTTLAALIRN